MLVYRNAISYCLFSCPFYYFIMSVSFLANSFRIFKVVVSWYFFSRLLLLYLKKYIIQLVKYIRLRVKNTKFVRLNTLMPPF